MNVVLDLFAPIPIVALAVTAFVLVLVWILSRYFRMPSEFRLKEEFRDEVRYMLISEEIGNIAKAKADAEKAAEEAEEAEREKEREKRRKEAAAKESEGAAEVEPPAGIKKAAVGGGKKG
jgi:flagellar biosynthesis/type III secretory pathway M-ring protein FliF/YscJ